MLYFIVNEKSKTGKAKSTWEEIKAILAMEEISYKAWTTEYEGHAAELASDITSRMPDDIIKLVVVGGDGTINEVVNGIKKFHKVRLGVIPNGSGNDFVRGMKMEREIREYLRDIASNNYEDITIDLGKVSWKGGKAPRLFAISSGVGLDAIVCKKALTSKIKKFLNAIHLGKLTYVVLTVITLFSMDTYTASMMFDNEEAYKFKKFIFGAGMNLRAEGGGVPMAPHADYNDGKLSFCIAYGIPKFITFFMLPLLVAAKHEKLKGFKVIDSTKCDIHLDKPCVLHTDGEYIAEVTDLRFECLKDKMHVMI